MTKPAIGFLGPYGTFTEEALLKMIGGNEQDLTPYSSIQEVIAAVNSRDSEKGFVAIENSIEGSVNTTLDMLAFEADVLIEREVVAAISHNLLCRYDLHREDIKAIISHPQATAQCRAYLTRHFPGAVVEAANSTAEAAKLISEQRGDDTAAIGTSLAAELYGLKILDHDIQDFKENRTRFVLLGHEPAERTGKDKTSIVCFIEEDRPGSLLEILQEFAAKNINLTKIQSRPTREALGQYYFFIDFEGHISDPQVSAAISKLRETLREVKVLGSYPRA